MNTDIVLAIAAIVITLVLASASRLVRAILLESLGHPFRKARIQISGTDISIQDLSEISEGSKRGS